MVGKNKICEGVTWSCGQLMTEFLSIFLRIKEKKEMSRWIHTENNWTVQNRSKGVSTQTTTTVNPAFTIIPQ